MNMEGNSDLLNYFSKLELLKMTEYQKMKYKNEIEKYRMLQKIGMDIPKPAFMERGPVNPPQAEEKPRKTKKGRQARDGNSDEDDEWLPPIKTKKITQKSGQNQPTSAKILRAVNTIPLQVDKAGTTTNGEASGVRYPKRARQIPNYKEADVPNCDDFIFCDECQREWEGDCESHPLQIVKDKEVPEDEENEERAIDTTPSMLAVDDSKIPNAGLGVWARSVVPYRTLFGPYEGKIVPADVSTGYGWQIYKNGKPVHCIDASKPGLSNWMRYVNCARHKNEQNLFAFQYRGQVFYRTTRDIAPLQELLVYYGDDYGKELGIDSKQFNAELQNPLKELFFKCQTCNSTFSSPVYLKRHRCVGKRGILVDTTIQETGRSFAYQECATTYTTLHNLVFHSTIPSGECPYRCTHCNQSFTQASILSKELHVQTGDKPFTCPNCPAKFSKKMCFKVHLRTHTGEKPFQCPHCEKRFSRKRDLNVHLRIHTGEKPFQCPHCEKRFSQKENLNVHLRIHTGEKPFQCPHCEKRFSRKGDLNVHLRIHTGEKPFQCPHCEKRFSRKGDLNVHVRIHAGGSLSTVLTARKNSLAKGISVSI